MRIGVLTYHCPPNFGAQLQAISTIGYLKRLGHEAIMLHWYPRDLEEMYSHRIPQQQIDCHKKFTEENLPISHLCQEESKLIQEIDKLQLNAIIVGSDALFKYVPERKRRHFSKKRLKFIYHPGTLSCELLDNNPFFGAFLSQLKSKIPASVYAVSSQNCPYQLLTISETKKMALALSNYRYISVRDKWTQGMVQTVSKRFDVRVCPDPVFSFKQNNYLELPSKENLLQRFGISDKYILFSFRDKFCPAEYIQQLAQESISRGYQPVALPMPEHLFDAGIEKKINLPLSPIDWYSLIVHSAGYIGERMHPIVVCLHNSIPFFSFDEYGIKVKKNWWSRQLTYNPSSSKTYLIVSDAGLQNNIYSYQTNQAKPTPQVVLDRIEKFDIDHCTSFAQLKQEEYTRGMEEVINSLEGAR